MIIVLNTFGSLGDLNPYLGIALGLKSMGHAPMIATAGVYREYVEEAGVGFHPVRPDVSIDDRETIRRVMNPKGGMEFLRGEDQAGPKQQPFFTRDNIFLSLTPVFLQDHASMY